MPSESLKSIWTDKASATEIFIIDVNRISRTELDAAYFSMSSCRRKKCDSLKFSEDKKLCIAADMLLRQVLSDRIGIASEELIFKTEENGKPCLENREYHFNVSHSGNFAAIAVNKEHPVGIDIERIKPLSALIAKRIFSEKDINFVFGSAVIPDGKITEREMLIRFFKVWTYKEAFVKMTGEGITDNIKNYCYDEKRCFSHIFDDYAVTVITENEKNFTAHIV